MALKQVCVNVMVEQIICYKLKTFTRHKNENHKNKQNKQTNKIKHLKFTYDLFDSRCV